MVNGTVPIKTPDGQAELSTRVRRVSQRHRTVLFLVDGKRSTVEVRQSRSDGGRARQLLRRARSTSG